MFRCERCGTTSAPGYSGSYFDPSTVCIDCRNIEEAHPDYAHARGTEEAAVGRGDWSFPGVGVPADLVDQCVAARRAREPQTTTTRQPEEPAITPLTPHATTDPPIDTADLQITLEEHIGGYLFDHHREGFHEETAMDAGRDILRLIVLGLSGDELNALRAEYAELASG